MEFILYTRYKKQFNLKKKVQKDVERFKITDLNSPNADFPARH